MNQQKLIGNTPHWKTHPPTPNRVRHMPHEHIELAQTPNGEIGPRCNSCGTRLTFGEAMVVDKHYYCWNHYVEITGADTATIEIQREIRFWKEWRFKGLRCPPYDEVVQFLAGLGSHIDLLSTIALRICGHLLDYALGNGCLFHLEEEHQFAISRFLTWTVLEGSSARGHSIRVSIQQLIGKNHMSWKWLTKTG